MIAAATVHDILLWLLVTVLFGLVDSPENWAGKYQPVASLLLVMLFICLLVKVFLPGATKVVSTRAWLSMTPVNRLLVTITCMSLSGLVTDMLQVHTLVGIVAFGACTPQAERPFILSHVEVMNRALLLPLFFGSAGLKVYLNRASPAVGGIFLGLTGSCDCDVLACCSELSAFMLIMFLRHLQQLLTATAAAPSASPSESPPAPSPPPPSAAGLIGQIFGCIIPACAAARSLYSVVSQACAGTSCTAATSSAPT